MNKHFRPRSAMERKANELKRGINALAYYAERSTQVQSKDATKDVLARHTSNTVNYWGHDNRGLSNKPVKEDK